MTTLLAVDPSLRATGWALFESATLKDCGVIEPVARLSNIMSVRSIFDQLPVGGIDEVALEFPRIYPKGRGNSDRVDPNDLLWVAAVAGTFSLAPLGETTHYYPSDWKGQSKKEKTLRIVLQVCTPAERRVIEQVTGAKRHNAVDAVGIGMYHLKRIGKNIIKEIP